MSFSFQTASFTHIGGRTINQDFSGHIIERNYACFLVLDGLGGHEHGEVASSYLGKAILSLAPSYTLYFENEPDNAMATLVHDSVFKMRKDIKAEFGRIDAHTTLAMVWMNPGVIVSCHIGDSRVYRLKQNEIVWRTKDHTFVQKLLDEHRISENEMQHHMLQNMLLRTVSTQANPDPEIHMQGPLTEGEALLLCTDGFWTNCSKENMTGLIESHNLKHDLQKLVDNIVQVEGKDCDNVTVEIARVG